MIRYILTNIDTWQVIHSQIYASDLWDAGKKVESIMQFDAKRQTQSSIEYERRGQAIVWHYRLEEDR